MLSLTISALFKLKVTKVFNDNASEMVYFGVELKKDGTPKKNGDKRDVFQSNIIK